MGYWHQDRWAAAAANCYALVPYCGADGVGQHINNGFSPVRGLRVVLESPAGISC